MEDEIDLLINMAGWWSMEEGQNTIYFNMPFDISCLNLCPSVWSIDFTSPLIFT